MDTKEKLRVRMTRDVLRLVRVRDFRAALPPLADGVAPIAIGFRDDSVMAVVEQIGQLGGNAHVVIPPADLDTWPNGIALLQIQIQKGERASQPEKMTDDDCPVNADSELGMLLALLMVHRKPITFHVCRHETTVELVDDGKDVVPA